MNFATKLCCLFLAFANFSYVFGVTTIPAKQTFPMEGSLFEVTCFVPGTEKLEDVKFLDKYNTVIENSTDGNRVFSKTISGFNQTLKLHWKSMPVNDVTISSLACHVGDTAYQYRIIVIPFSSKPKITLSPENTTSANKGEGITLSCNAEIVMQKTWTFALQWVFNGEVLTSQEKRTIAVTVDKPGNKSSTLTVTNLENSDEGFYTCQANINIANHQTESQFSKKVLISVKWENDDAPKKQELIRQDQESVEMVCNIIGYPVPTFRWQKGDTVISASSDVRYSFSNNSKSEGANSSFTISKVTYKDRSKYYCVATFPAGKSMRQEFILRVRDPLGALWPAIGILIEAILLFLIIALYTCFKKSKSSGNDSDGAPVQGETSPLVKDTPRISYTSGEDRVRSRVTSNENA